MRRALFLVALGIAGAGCGYLVSSAALVVRFERDLLGTRFRESRNAGEKKLAARAAGFLVDEALLQERLDIQRAQFSEGEWKNALAGAGIRPDDFVARLREHQRVLGWLEGEIRDRVGSGPSEAEAYYEAHRELFTSPLRRRARHIFFAAPDGLEPELMTGKRQAAQTVMNRLIAGEPFESLATASEDEATEERGGDLNFFSENRMLPEIWNALAAQKIGDAPILVKSHLGFHVIQLTDERPSDVIPFAAASSEIARAIENEKRRAAIAGLAERSD